MRRSVVATLLGVVLLVAACGSDPLEGDSEGSGGDEIIIGSFDFSESRVLAHIYAEALRETGAENVTVPASTGARKVVLEAMRDGSLNVVPEYTGNLLRHFDKDMSVSKPEAVYSQLKQTLPDQFRVLDFAAAQNKDQLVVRKELAAEGVSTISDLAPRCDELVFGGPGQWEQRWQQTIESLYGCDFARIKATGSDGPRTVDALNSGDIDVADLFSTDPAVSNNDFVALEDDKNMFPAQNVVPLVNKGVLSQQQRQALNDVSQVLTTEKLTRLNVELTEKKRNPADIAKDFVESNDLG